MLDPTINTSVKYTTKDNNDIRRQIVSLVNYVIVCGVISLCETITNIINMIVFTRQGMNTTINISFFSLSLSDLCSLIFQQMFNIYMNPLFIELHLPISYPEFQYLTTALTREMFARITCLVTAFITAERCLCVVFPLHIKRFITPRISATVIFIIFIFTLISPTPMYSTYYYTWKFYPQVNRTLLGFAVNKDNEVTEPMCFIWHAVFTMLGFLSVLTFTLILIYKLQQKNTWRQTANVDLEKAKSMSKRDRATITMVVVIAIILIMCYTPAVLLCLATGLEPEFNVGGQYYDWFTILWSVALVFENINSSVNIFLYLRMSSKYRQTFRDVFSRCYKTKSNWIKGL